MKIRQATIADSPQMKELLEEFMNESLRDFGVKIEDQALDRTIQEVMGSCMVLENKDDKIIGLLAGKIINEPTNNSKVFQEIIWYTAKAYRRHGLSLLKEMENWCRDKGIMAMIMVRMGNSMPEKVARFYERIGYRHMECHYLKRF